jgi:hypothetical protein
MTLEFRTMLSPDVVEEKERLDHVGSLLSNACLYGRTIFYAWS